MQNDCNFRHQDSRNQALLIDNKRNHEKYMKYFFNTFLPDEEYDKNGFA